MKRCPKCEFTFDDHQEFCDFDGAELSVVPELVPSLPVTGSRLRFLSAVRSPVTLAGLLLVGVTLSALMIGYYDAANSPDSMSGRNLAHGEQIQLNRSSRVPAYISIERRVNSAKEASSMPSSAIKWLAEDPESESSQSRSDSTTSETPTTLQAKTKRASRSNRQSFANNRKNASKLSNQVAQRGSNRDSAAGRRQKYSKVTAILKKTGSILSWPFKL